LPAASDTGECEVLVDSRRTQMTIVRIAQAEPRPGRLPGDGFETRGVLVVLNRRGRPPGGADLADGAGRGDLAELAARPAADISSSGAPQELAARLLRAAGASATWVDIAVTEPVPARLSGHHVHRRLQDHDLARRRARLGQLPDQPGGARLRPGRHVAGLVSMLITMTNVFRFR
jgi:hypothetical protein